jgi:HAD superfamily hydrolase (TIGR01509 family)
VGRLEAVLWDVDGTLAETERDGHRIAFNLAFEHAGLPWRWDEARYGELLAVTGGRERLLHDMGGRPDAPVPASERMALAASLHRRKNAIYADLVRSGSVVLRAGVQALMNQCRERSVAMAVTTTTSRANVDALLRAALGERWAEWFAAIVCGEDVVRKKPDPAVYLQALEMLGIEASAAVAIEDSPAGVAAARGAGIPVLVTRSAYFADAPVEGVMAIGPGLHQRAGWRPRAEAAHAANGSIGIDDVLAWRAQARAASRSG